MRHTTENLMYEYELRFAFEIRLIVAHFVIFKNKNKKNISFICSWNGFTNISKIEPNYDHCQISLEHMFTCPMF